MLNLKKLQTSTALALTVGMSSTALVPIALMGSATAAPAPKTLAQLFPSAPRSTPSPIYSGAVTIPAGTTLPVSYEQAEKIVVAPNETLKTTLTIPVNLRNNDRDRTILIPAGSKLEGEFQPIQNGTQFVARTLIFPNGTRQGIDAISNVETRRETIRRGVSTDALLKGAAIGSGAATLISGITGNKRITAGKILIGTGVGALGGLLLGRNQSEVVVVNPSNLRLRLNSAIALNAY
ncbi:hypothetical protein [Myxacorys almedinensis]|uniref:Uncharacterized protein n=1 Tax=Myxacorys almedinensis A TaxID=2690445 RepID=A0A8J7Z5T6_9CYAN|nr:hypothetical protein [Myxacorys almedinensis]NDJ18416.1 hypothetical protein [Myxacorys almedinensis A]